MYFICCNNLSLSLSLSLSLIRRFSMIYFPRCSFARGDIWKIMEEMKKKQIITRGLVFPSSIKPSTEHEVQDLEKEASKLNCSIYW